VHGGGLQRPTVCPAAYAEHAHEPARAGAGRVDVMRVLLTGASSFTGCWFACELAAAGHEVTVTHRASSYDGVRRQRVARVAETCRAVHRVAFRDDEFVNLVAGGGFDILCVHGARVAGYRDPAFDVAAALAENTHRAAEIVPHVPRVLV